MSISEIVEGIITLIICGGLLAWLSHSHVTITKKSEKELDKPQTTVLQLNQTMKSL